MAGEFICRDGQELRGNVYVRFEVFTAVTMKNVDLCDVTLCGFCKKRCFEGAYSPHHQGEDNKRARNN
jgi:hypothetical protein